MNDEITIPDVKLDLPLSYSWKKGLGCGIIGGGIIFLVSLFFICSFPHIPARPWTELRELRTWVTALIFALPFFLYFGVWGAFVIKTEKHKNNKYLKTANRIALGGAVIFAICASAISQNIRILLWIFPSLLFIFIIGKLLKKL